MSEPRVERRLAAILAADVVGYSRLVGIDEEGTLERLKVLRREFADPVIKEHRGRIVRITGDGLLVESASVVDAVRCAVDVQREMAARDAEVPQNQRIEFGSASISATSSGTGRISTATSSMSPPASKPWRARRNLRQPRRAATRCATSWIWLRRQGRAESRISRGRSVYFDVKIAGNSMA